MTRIGTIDTYREFLTLRELHEQFVRLSGEGSVSRIGLSKNKEQILCGKFGNGKEAALVFAGGHPNEPIGSLACVSWVKMLKKNPHLLGKYTWYIVPCVDPDGYKLNEGWFKGKFSFKKYAHHFYRQIVDQTEHSFPVRYKKYSFDRPTRPTKVLMRLIDRIKPSLVYPVHNSGISGVYVLLTRQLEDPFFKAVESICRRLNIPIQRRSPEAPSAKVWRPGFIKLPRLQDEYEELVRLRQDPRKTIIGGWSSIDYATSKNGNVFGMVCEVPFIYDPIFLDDTPSSTTKSAAVQLQIDENVLVRDAMARVLTGKGLNKKSVFYAVSKENHTLLTTMIRTLQATRSSIPQGNCSRSEAFFSRVVNVFYRTLMLGELRRLLLDSEPSTPHREMVAMVEKMIERRVRFVNKNSDYSVVPISRAVEFQVSCLIAALESL